MLYLESLRDVRKEYSSEFHRSGGGESAMNTLLDQHKELCEVKCKAVNRDGESFLGKSKYQLDRRHYNCRVLMVSACVKIATSKTEIDEELWLIGNAALGGKLSEQARLELQKCPSKTERQAAACRSI